jgi:hypothetical protein
VVLTTIGVSDTVGVLLRNRAWADLRFLSTRCRLDPIAWQVAVFDRAARARRAIRHYPRGMAHQVVRIR